MSAPNVADLATSLVTVAPSPANSGTSLTVTTGEGDRFPAVPFNATVVPEGEFPTIDNAEIVLVTAVTDDVFTITRAQGVTTAMNIAVGWRIFNGIYAAHIEGAYQAAADVPFDDTVISTASGGQVTGDTVQEFGDNFVSFLVPVITGLFVSLGTLDGRIDDLENSTGPVEPRDRLNVLIGLEDRAKYAFLGGGKFSNYDSNGFKIPNPGNLADGGFDIYNEYVPLWQGASTDYQQYTFQEIFTIEDDAAWGGDLLETAICWKGRTPVPFVEVTAADSATENGSGNGYGEYPSVIYTADQYNGDMFMLQRVRYTYNPSTGQLKMYRPIYDGETADSTAFGIGWKTASTIDHQNPGSHPIANVDPTKSLKVGKGSGRYLVSRVTVNAFDGTPYCDFNPVANTVDADTVYDPVIDDNWTNADSGFARILNTEQFVDNWFTDEAIAGRNAHFVGTWSANSLTLNDLDGGYISLLADYVATDGDIIRVRTAGTTDIGNGSETFAVNDLIWWDGTTWRHIYVTDPATKANVAHTHDDRYYTETEVDALLAAVDATSGFSPTGDYDRTSTYVYLGYEHSDGRWYIYRRTLSNNTKLYASGSSAYATNWTGRAGLTYS